MTRSTSPSEETFVHTDIRLSRAAANPVPVGTLSGCPSNTRSSDGTGPCVTCGACCAHYRASFYWMEADDAGGTVPVGMTENYDSFRRAMMGSNQPNPRCVALTGEIGVAVACSIYERRSSVCREFPVAWESGEPNDKCDRARIAWGLSPLPVPDHSKR